MHDHRKALAIQKMHDFYAIKPGAPVYKREFGFFVLDRWIDEGHLKPFDAVDDYEAYLRGVFHYDEPACHTLYGLGWCEAALCPEFEVKQLADLGDHELVQDFAGRGVVYFKGRRSGFMPEYRTHPVTDQKSFENNILWRMNPGTPERLANMDALIDAALDAEARGEIVRQGVVGGFMYLRSLVGISDLPYLFYDDPELIHACMRAWLELADAMTSRAQARITFNELFIAEDICYNHGPLISPQMMRDFLFPYYIELYEGMKKRNRGRPMHFQVDTDGFCEPVIDVYRSIGVDFMSPFEVASNCDVVRVGRKYPDLLMSGGIDKRLIAKGGDHIKRHLEAIMPVMRARGGFYPTCDHGVPEETSFENYMLYRQLMDEYCDG